MRIAICMTGQLRTGILAFPNLKHFFGDLFNRCDFFVHTWDINTHRNVMAMNIPPRPLEIVSKEQLDLYSSLYSCKKFVVEDHKNFINPFIKKHGSVGELIHLYYSFYSAIQLKKSYEEENNFKYDVVIKLRPDIIFPINRNFEKDLEQFYEDTSKLYSCRRDDFYHIASSLTMDRVAEFYNDPSNENWHNWPMNNFLKFLLNEQIEFEGMNDARFTILRPESSYMDVINNYDNICLLNAHLYDHIFHSTHDIDKFYINLNSKNWIEDMYVSLEKILSMDIIKKLEETLPCRRGK